MYKNMWRVISILVCSMLFLSACSNKIDFGSDTANINIITTDSDKTEGLVDINEEEIEEESGELVLSSEDFALLDRLGAAINICRLNENYVRFSTFEDVSVGLFGKARYLDMTEALFFGNDSYDDEYLYGEWVDVNYSKDVFNYLMGINDYNINELVEKSNGDDGIELDEESKQFRVYSRIVYSYYNNAYVGHFDEETMTYYVTCCSNGLPMYKEENSLYSTVDFLYPVELISLQLEKDSNKDNPFGYRICGLSRENMGIIQDEYTYTLTGYDSNRTAGIDINDIDWNEYRGSLDEKDVQSLSDYDKVLTDEEQIVYFENDDAKGKEMSLSQLEASKHIFACSFVDMDQDGIDEMILATDYSEYDIIILSRKGDKVYSTVRKRDDLSCLSSNGLYAKIRYIPEFEDEWIGKIIAEISYSYRRMLIDETGVHETEIYVTLATVDEDKKQYYYYYENGVAITLMEASYWEYNNLAPLVPFYALNE